MKDIYTLLKAGAHHSLDSCIEFQKDMFTNSPIDERNEIFAQLHLDSAIFLLQLQSRINQINSSVKVEPEVKADNGDNKIKVDYSWKKGDEAGFLVLRVPGGKNANYPIWGKNKLSNIENFIEDLQKEIDSR